MFTDKQIDAAALAYIGARFGDPEAWRRAFPQAYADLRERIVAALTAAEQAKA